jgi:rhodanese-related sulfurtransferase
MPAPNAITPDKLARLIGTPACPMLIDVRTDRLDLIPGSVRRSAESVDSWGDRLGAASAVIICEDGAHASPGVAAWLRSKGQEAEILEGGVGAWVQAQMPTIREAALPPRDEMGRTRWVTRARPKVDRVACPWLIRRFVDPDAVILFVSPSEVEATGKQMGAAPFDVEGVFWSHRGELCTFDVMIEEFGLATPPLLRLATIVRAADTARLDLAPEAPGLLAASLGLSRMYADDLEQLEAGLNLYDAFYRWCRDASTETHNWPTAKTKA